MFSWINTIGSECEYVKHPDISSGCGERDGKVVLFVAASTLAAVLLGRGHTNRQLPFIRPFYIRDIVFFWWLEASAFTPVGRKVWGWERERRETEKREV